MRVHIDTKAILAAIGLVLTFIVQQVPPILQLPVVQSHPVEVRLLTLVLQIATVVLALLSEFHIVPIPPPAPFIVEGHDHEEPH